MTTTLQPGEDRRGLALAGAGVEVRADGDGGQRFVGHAAVFDSRTAIGNPLSWGFYEEIAPSAFTKTLSEGDARMLIDHDSYYVVSRVSAGTLELAQDDVGLAVDSALDTRLSYVADLIANLDNQNITGMSFGFYVVKDEWFDESVELPGGQTGWVEVRRLLEIRLVEVSAVTFPAYEATDAGVRAQLIAEDEVRAVGLALGRRGRVGQELLEARSRRCPGLADYLARERVAADSAASARSDGDLGQVRGAVAKHSTDTDEASWSGPGQEEKLKDLDQATGRAMYAWRDPDGDVSAKASWKFPHHFVGDDGTPGDASTAACTNAIAVLNGGRGGSSIPDGDRQGVYDHLAKHLTDAGLEPAELNAREPAETTRENDEHDHQHARDDEPAQTTRPTYRELVRREERMRRPLAAAPVRV